MTCDGGGEKKNKKIRQFQFISVYSSFTDFPICARPFHLAARTHSPRVEMTRSSATTATGAKLGFFSHYIPSFFCLFFLANAESYKS